MWKLCVCFTATGVTKLLNSLEERQTVDAKVVRVGWVYHVWYQI